MQLTIDVGSMSALLRILSGTFHGLVQPIRIQALDHARKIRLSLSMDALLAMGLMSALVSSLPSAEIGRITHV